MSSSSLSKHLEFRRQLLGWYAKHKRDLPWRKNTDPYRILVSEFMCQQTQIKTVLPYYAKFMKLFPTAKALAKAPEESVLAAWAGLGYYRRARFLQGAAKAVAVSGFPETGEGLMELPGVGAYTAAAIGSISFGLPMAVVDGNVIRVLSRLLAMDVDAKSREGAALLRGEAARLLDPAQPGNYNQALMELGALVCSPRQPACELCPVSKRCKAYALGKPEAYPRLPAAPEVTAVRKAVALMVCQGSVLAAPRGKGGRMAGLWHFPELELTHGQTGAAEAAKLALSLWPKAGLKPEGSWGLLKHTVTRYRISVEAFGFRTEAKPAAPPAPWAWIPLARLKSLPLASAEKRLAAMALSQKSSKGTSLKRKT